MPLAFVRGPINELRSLRLKPVWVALVAFGFSIAASASSGITYQGRILKPDGSPLSGSNVQFKLQIRTPDANNCLMYEEMQTLDMHASNGVFALTINDGSGSRTDATGLNLDRIFSNAQGTANVFNFNPATCNAGSSYSPSTSDGRSFVVYFKDETMAAYEPMPAQKINFIPLAFEAKQIAGFTPASLVRVAEADGTLGSVSPLSNANYTELLALINGTTVQYEKAGKISGVAVPSMTTGQVLGWNGSAWTSVDPLSGVQTFAKTVLPTCGAGQFLKDNGSGLLVCATPAGSGGTVTQVNTGTGLTGGGFTTSGTISIAAGGVGTTELAANAVTTAKITDLNVTTVKIADANVTLAKLAADSVDSSKIADGSITGADLNAGINITTSGTIVSGVNTTRDFKLYPAGAGTNKISFAAPVALAADYTITFPLTAGGASQVLTTDGSGNLSWSTPAGTGISALTGDVTASGSGSVAATVAAVGGVTAANVATGANLANAATNLNTASTIVKRDASGNFAAGNITGGVLTQTSSVYKDTGANTVTVQAPTTVTSSYVMKWPVAVAVSAGQVLSSDTSGNLSWSALPTALPPNGAAGGDLSGSYPNPSVATVGGSTAANINTATIAANAATAVNTASKIVARDASGNFAANVATVNGVALNNAGSVLNITNPVGGTWNMTLPATAGTSGQVMQTNGSGVMTWLTPLTSSTAYVNGGNSFGANASIGTNDAFRLDVKTNNAPRVTISSAGNVGIGTTAPTNLLDVNGSLGVGYPTTAAGTANSLIVSGRIGIATANPTYDLEVNGIANVRGATSLATSSGNVGIGLGSPATKLEVAGTLKLGDGGETCGASYAGGVRYNGGNIQFCNGTSWSTLGVAGAGITALTGDVTASGTGSVAATVANVGGVTAANVATGANLANAATNLNTASTLVKRDASGNFAASAITSTSNVLKDTGSNTVTLAAPTSVTTSYSLKFPVAVAGVAGQVLASDTSGNMSWSSLPTALPPNGSAGGDLSGSYPNPTVATVGTSTAAQVHSAELAANAATAANTASAIVSRDGSGNFAANVATVNGLALKNAGSILNITNPVGGAWNMTLPATAGTSGQVMQTNGSGVMTWTTPLTSSTGFLNGGNSFGANASIGTNDAFRLDVKTNNISRMTVDSSGNVGIGTTNPSYILDVVTTGNSFLPAAIRNSSTGTTAAAGLVFQNDVANAQLFYTNSAYSASPSFTPSSLNFFNGQAGGIQLSAASAAGSIRLITGGASERMRVDSNGNVGIGTTLPAASLDVAGAARFSGSTFPATGSGVEIGYWSGAGFFGAADRTGNANRPLHIYGNPVYIGGGTPASQTNGAIKIDANNNVYVGGGNYSSLSPLGIGGGVSVGSYASTVAAPTDSLIISGSVGIGTSAPATKLDVVGTLKIGDGGETCGASYAGGVRYNGGNVQFCNGTSWSTLGVAGAGITALTGDVTASGTGSVAATVAQVGGVTAANVATGANLANAATNLNTVSTIVKRDASGNFAAGAVTSTSNILKDIGANTVTLSAPTSVTTSYSLKLPTAVAASSGQVLASDTSGNMSWSSLPTALPPNGSAGGDLSGTYPNPTVATVGTSTAAQVHSAELAANAATAANTASAIVSRDGSGNFAANVATVNGLALKNAGSILNITNPVGGAWNMTLPATAGTSGQVMQTNGSGVMTWTTPLTSSTGFINGGNSFGANASIGTNDAFRLDVKTNNAVAMTVDATGKVGIGTTNPSNLLSVGASSQFTVSSAGAATATGYAMVRGAADAYMAVPGLPSSDFGLINTNVADGNTVLERFNVRNSSSIVQNAYIGAVSTSGAANYSPAIVFGQTSGGGTNYVERVRVDQNGNVGIGTTAPGNILSVGADIGATGNPANSIAVGNATGNSYVTVGQDNANRGRIAWYYNATPANAYMIVGPRDSSQALVLGDSGSKVGVGTTAPTTKLEVAGTLKIGDGGETCGASFDGAVRYNGGAIQFCNGTAWGAIGSTTGTTVNAAAGTAASPSLSFSGDPDTGLYSNGANVIGISAGGSNVFNVSSSGLVSPTTGGASVTTANGTAAAPTYSFAGDTGTGWWRPAASTMAASTGGAERMRIDNAGNVGIGTTAPNTSSKLDVNGAIYVSGLNGISFAPDALVGNSIGIGPSALGSLAGASLHGDVAIGTNALSTLTSGGQSTAIGYGAAQYKNSNSSGNTAFGYNALNGVSANSSPMNTAIGYLAGYNNTTGGYNTMLGYGAGYMITTGSHNIVVGDFNTSGSGITTGSNNIVIGQDITPASNTASNQLNIGNLIFATGLSSASTMSTGSVGIGTTAPSSKLEVSGAIAASTGSAAAPSFTFAGNTNTGLYSEGANFVDIASNGSRVALFTSAGSGSATFAVGSGVFQGGQGAVYTPTSGSAGSPGSEQVMVTNNATTNGAAAMFFAQPRNAATTFQTAYFGAVSNTAGTTPTIVIGQQTGNNAYAERMRIDTAGNVGIGTTAPETTLDVNGPATLRQAYFENVGDLGSLACGPTSITGFTTNLYNLTACSSGTTILNIPAVSGWPAGKMSWTVTFFVTGQTSSFFNVSYNGATTNVYWDKNSTGGPGGSGYGGFPVASGSTDLISCSVLNTGTVKVYCGVGAQY